MGKIADLILDNCHIESVLAHEDRQQVAGEDEAELAIKEHIAKLGRELIKDIADNYCLDSDRRKDMLAGVKELMARIEKL